MKRLAAVLAAAAFGTGCHSEAPRATPQGGIDLNWSFVRTINDGASTPTQVSYTCASAGIDTVVVSLGGGSVALPCADNVGDGGAIAISPGTYDVLVSAYRGGTGGVLLYNTQINGVAIVANQTTVLNPVPLDARFAPFQINARFQTLGGAPFATCEAAGVDTISFHLVDHAGTSVYTSGNLVCTGPFGLVFDGSSAVGPVDLDTYTIRIVATGASFDFDSAAPPGCGSQVFSHYGTDVGPAAWNVPVYDVTNVTLCP
jgi:hypothetical protein